MSVVCDSKLFQSGCETKEVTRLAPTVTLPLTMRFGMSDSAPQGHHPPERLAGR